MSIRILKSFILEEVKRLHENAPIKKQPLIFLIGPPAVGKSHILRKEVEKIPQLSGVESFNILSHDDVVTEIAEEFGITYDDYHKKLSNDDLTSLGLALPIVDEEALSAGNFNFDKYMKDLQGIADQYNSNPENQTSQIMPFSKENVVKALTPRDKGGWGVPPNALMPFSFENIKGANMKSVSDKVSNTFSSNKEKFALSSSPLVVDMTMTSRAERDRLKSDIDKIIKKSHPESGISDFFTTHAYVFADPKTKNYDENQRNDIMAKGNIRASEQNKTIPRAVYDRMFSGFQPPTEDEGFETIKYVGVPSIGVQGESRILKNSIDKLIHNHILKIKSFNR
jgi:hypothetical protein